MAQTPFVIIPSLLAIAVSYPQGECIADRVLPRVPVDTEAFSYLKHGLGDAFRVPDTKVGRKSAPNQLDWGSTLMTAMTQDHGLDTAIPNKDILAYNQARAAGPGLVGDVDPVASNTALLMQALLNRRESRAANLVFNAATYGVDNKTVLSGGGQWSDFANSDPLSAMMGYLDSMVVRANVLTLGRAVATKLRLHPKICKAVYGNNTDAGVIDLRALADKLELEEILVGDAWLDTAVPGQPTALARCWGKHAAFTVRNKKATTKAGVTFGLTAQWGERVAGTIQDGDVGLRGGTRVRVGESVVELATANDLGFFVQNAIA